jgi:hypothetical protein
LQESAAVQMLLETCIETEDDRRIGGQQWALQEVRSLVCSYLHQVFIADTMLAKLVHFQVSLLLSGEVCRGAVSAPRLFLLIQVARVHGL